MTPELIDGKLLLSQREAAKALGICPKSLYNRTAPRGDILCVKIGSRVMYDPRDLTAWIDAQKNMKDGGLIDDAT